jgi:hypothetical protein
VTPVPEAPPLPPAEFDRLVEEVKKDVDRTLIRENLKLTVEQRLIQLTRFQGKPRPSTCSASTACA